MEIYTDEGRPAEFNAVCQGTTADNGLYGEGIVNAAAAVAPPVARHQPSCAGGLADIRVS